jgi:hypothetical protein
VAGDGIYDPAVQIRVWLFTDCVEIMGIQPRQNKKLQKVPNKTARSLPAPVAPKPEDITRWEEEGGAVKSTGELAENLRKNQQAAADQSHRPPRRKSTT